jgi:hypothetical protein
MWLPPHNGQEHALLAWTLPEALRIVIFIATGRRTQML